MKPNGVVITHGIIQVRSEIARNEWVQPFGERIKTSIEERKAVAATDASVKDGKMGGVR